jgi:hypothetical protein
MKNKINHIYQNIEGWCGFQQEYIDIVNKASSPSHFVEIGAWKGKSTSVMAVEIANSGKKIQFDVVDTWRGSIEHVNDKDVLNGDLYKVFTKNLEPVKDHINPIRLPSLEAAKLYKDNSLDFVFIDASHDYENVIADIRAWYPKVKLTGIIGGHDFTWCLDVQRAVKEFAEENSLEIRVGHDSCWFYNPLPSHSKIYSPNKG